MHHETLHDGPLRSFTIALRHMSLDCTPAGLHRCRDCFEMRRRATAGKGRAESRRGMLVLPSGAKLVLGAREGGLPVIQAVLGLRGALLSIQAQGKIPLASLQGRKWYRASLAAVQENLYPSVLARNGLVLFSSVLTSCH